MLRSAYARLKHHCDSVGALFFQPSIISVSTKVELRRDNQRLLCTHDIEEEDVNAERGPDRTRCRTREADFAVDSKPRQRPAVVDRGPEASGTRIRLEKRFLIRRNTESGLASGASTPDMLAGTSRYSECRKKR